MSKYIGQEFLRSVHAKRDTLEYLLKEDRTCNVEKFDILIKLSDSLR